MKGVLPFLFAPLLAAWTPAPPAEQLPPPAREYILDFNQDFDDFDLSPDGAGLHNWYEGIWFHPKHTPHSNILASSSVLSLVWSRNQETPDTSVTTLSRDFRHFRVWRYGYFEARMKWDVVKGAWPAFWLIPVEAATKKDIPGGVRQSGEIDIFEGQGQNPHEFYGTIHVWTNLKDSASKENTFHLPPDVDLSEYHIYGLLWVPGEVTWYLDNRALHSEKTPRIFDEQTYFIVLGMQEGVDWKYGALAGVTADKFTLNVDWVRVWQQKSKL
jgi:beta-glucanase (GH16 family)